MLTVDDNGKLRVAHRDGMSIRAIARTFKHSRRKVREILANPQPKPYALAKPKPAPVLGSHHSVIDAMLAGDEDAPPFSMVPIIFAFAFSSPPCAAWIWRRASIASKSSRVSGHTSTINSPPHVGQCWASSHMRPPSRYSFTDILMLVAIKLSHTHQRQPRLAPSRPAPCSSFFKRVRRFKACPLQVAAPQTGPAGPAAAHAGCRGRPADSLPATSARAASGSGQIDGVSG